MRARLRGHVHRSVPADLVSAEEVPVRHREHDLGPPADVGRPERQLEGVVPDHASVRLLAFVAVLRHAAAIALL